MDGLDYYEDLILYLTPVVGRLYLCESWDIVLDPVPLRLFLPDLLPLLLAFILGIMINYFLPPTLIFFISGNYAVPPVPADDRLDPLDWVPLVSVPLSYSTVSPSLYWNGWYSYFLAVYARFIFFESLRFCGTSPGLVWDLVLRFLRSFRLCIMKNSIWFSVFVSKLGLLLPDLLLLLDLFISYIVSIIFSYLSLVCDAIKLS